MRARRRAWAPTAVLSIALTAVSTAATIALGVLPTGAIVDGQTLTANDLAPDGPWSFLTDVAVGADGACSGSLVAPRWVLTAAHCAQGPLFVRVGNATEPTAVVDAVVHPRFVLDGPNGPEFDVALLRLATPSDAVPATLPATGDGLVPVGATVEIAGFGSSSPTAGTGAGTARVGTAEVVHSSDELLILLGAPSASAGGDSGGPAVSNGVLVGVHSFGVAGDPALPSGEMPVAPLVSWIRSVVDAVGVPPQVTSGELRTPIDTPIEFPVEIIDDEPVSIATQVTFAPTGGTVTSCASDTPPTTCVFTPSAGFEGFGGVEISVFDGTHTGVGGWSIVVGDPAPPPPNQLPEITSVRQLTTTPGRPVDFDLDFRDPDGTVLTLDDATLQVGTGGSVTCGGTVPPVVCTFAPDPGFAGTTFVRIVVSDGIGEGVRTISVRVVEGGLPPTVPDQLLAVDAGEPFTVALIADDDVLGALGVQHVVAFDEELSSTVALAGCDVDAVPVTCTYTTEPGRAGHARLTTTFSDGVHEATGVIDVTVLAGGAPPVITLPVPGTVFTAVESTTLTIPVEAIDPEGDEVAVRYSATFTAGSCTADDEDGRLVCLLDLPIGSAGQQAVTLYVVDGAGNTSTVDLTVDVTPFVGNLPPVAQLTLESSSVPLTREVITAHVVVDDPEGAAASCRIAWGDGAVSVVPASGDACVASHRYRVAGTMEITATATDADGETSVPVNDRLVITDRRARLEGDVSWRGTSGQYRLDVDASPRSGEVDLRLPGGRRLEGRVTTMQVFDEHTAEVRGTGRLGRQLVHFVLIVTDGGRGRHAVDTVSVSISDAAGNVIVVAGSTGVTGLTLR
jgi:hypothetical protein